MKRDLSISPNLATTMHEDDDVAIRSHYPSSFPLSMSKRFPASPLTKRRRSPGSPRSLRIRTPNSPRSPRSPRSKPGSPSNRQKSIIGQPWVTKCQARIPQLTLKPHQRPAIGKITLANTSPLKRWQDAGKKIMNRTNDQKQSTLRAVQRWKSRKFNRMNRHQIDSDTDSNLGKSCKTTTTTISNELSLFLCDVSGHMIKEFRKFDEDFSGELSKVEFECLMDDLRKSENFKLSKQDADLLYLAFDGDGDGTISTREVVEGLFKCHHRCPTNILGQRLLPRKIREHHNEKHGLQPASPRKKSVYEPLMMGYGSDIPIEYKKQEPALPQLPKYQLSPYERRQNFLWSTNDNMYLNMSPLDNSDVTQFNG